MKSILLELLSPVEKSIMPGGISAVQMSKCATAVEKSMEVSVPFSNDWQYLLSEGGTSAFW